MISAEEFFKELSAQRDKCHPFVAYRKPGLSNSPGVLKAFLQKDPTLHSTTDFLESGFVFAPFDPEGAAILIPVEFSRYLETILNDSGSLKPCRSEPVNSEDSLERQKHILLVQKGITSIQNNVFKKVVLSRKEILQAASCSAAEPLEIFRELTQKYPEAFTYIWFHPRVGLWLGATPETLLEVERNRFKTMALAGTQKYEGSLEVQWREKEKEEQQLVTDCILEDLKPLSEKIEVSGPYTARAGNLLHLKTDISGAGAGFGLSGERGRWNLKKLISAIHPTPAVCGLPRGSAKKFILEHENYDREFYSGFLGELNLKKTLQRSGNRKNRENQAYVSITRTSALFVNLRCMKLEDHHAVLFVGGGITKDSNALAEWEETSIKAETMKRVLFK